MLKAEKGAQKKLLSCLEIEVGTLQLGNTSYTTSSRQQSIENAVKLTASIYRNM